MDPIPGAPTRTVVGIQGGRGSFNEEAALVHLPTRIAGELELEYLHVADSVMASLTRGEIDLGQLALYNTVGGFYDESLHALAAHELRVVDRYTLAIHHALLAHPGTTRSEIRCVMTHPAVVHQCAGNLATRLSGLPVVHGEGSLLDPARVAQAIATGELPRDVATISNPKIAAVHGLAVLEADLEDAASLSWFLLVARGRAGPSWSRTWRQ